jgi:hypothetical protein
MGKTEDSPRQSIALGAHKTKSKEFYDIVRHIGARATPRSFFRVASPLFETTAVSRVPFRPV